MDLILNILKGNSISALMCVLGFYIPHESGEKDALEITILMACVIFLNIVSGMQPPSSNIPLISTYFTSILVMVACSVVSQIVNS